MLGYQWLGILFKVAGVLFTDPVLLYIIIISMGFQLLSFILGIIDILKYFIAIN